MRQARSITRLASGGALHVGGTRGGVPVLFLHGVGGAAWSWEPQAEALSDICRCFIWEARGHGLAARVADAGLGDYFVDAKEALASVAAAGSPPFVVGHSMGGLLAMALAAEFPAGVRALALLEPVYAPDGGRHLGGALAGVGRVALAPLVGSMQRDGAAARFLSRAVFDEAFEDRAACERAWRRQRTQVPVEYPKMMYEAFEGPTGFPNRAFAREIVQPVLFIEGTVAQKRPRFPEAIRDFQARLGERFSYHHIRGGHYLQLDRPADVNALLSNFVKTWA